METARRAAGICGTFRAANSAGDWAAEAGDFNGGPIAQNQFLCNGRTDFRHLVADLLLRMSFNILGLVFSLIGLSQINRHPELYEGRGLAIAGLILSAASLVLGFVLALLKFAFHPPNFGWHFKSF